MTDTGLAPVLLWVSPSFLDNTIRQQERNDEPWPGQDRARHQGGFRCRTDSRIHDRASVRAGLCGRAGDREEASRVAHSRGEARHSARAQLAHDAHPHARSAILILQRRDRGQRQRRGTAWDSRDERGQSARTSCRSTRNAAQSSKVPRGFAKSGRPGGPTSRPPSRRRAAPYRDNAEPRRGQDRRAPVAGRVPHRPPEAR